MRKDQLKNLPYLKLNRQILRKNQTQAEEILWQHLRKEQLDGRKFRRQHSIENYIVDFYCASERLIIEVDGSHHYERETLENDKERDSRLLQLNYRTLRFSNQAILDNPTEVLKQISESFLKSEAA